MKENNILLAEFLGWSITKHKIILVPYQMKNEQIRLLPMEELCYLADVSDLSFDYDWNWLIEVVDKIESLEDGKFDVSISVNYCSVFDWANNLEICKDETSPTKIESTYNACIAFVKWYNENK